MKSIQYFIDKSHSIQNSVKTYQLDLLENEDKVQAMNTLKQSLVTDKENNLDLSNCRQAKDFDYLVLNEFLVKNQTTPEDLKLSKESIQIKVQQGFDTNDIARESATKNLKALPGRYVEPNHRRYLHNSRLKLYAELLEFFSLKIHHNL